VSSVTLSDKPPVLISNKLPMRRLFWLPIVISGTLVMAVFAALVLVAWLGLMRVEPVRAHLGDIGRLRDLGLAMEQVLFQEIREHAQIADTELVDLRASLERDIQQGSYLNPETPARLRDISALLANAGANLDLLIDKVARDTRAELDLALVLVVVLPVLGIGSLMILRTRVQRPLAGLGDLLARLADRDYRPVPEKLVSDSSALVEPVFRSYNELVHRLQELEAEHNSREHTLEQEVRRATGALLTQSRQLARSERLAAVGAVSAGLAHELRNPLAGIQMACAKLQRVLADSDQSARLEAVVAELKRLNRLLTERVDSARHAPEPLTLLNLKDTVEDFLSLVRYQVPEGVRLSADIPEGLACRLPEGGLRQALLNLILNAAQSMENDEGEIAIHGVRDGQAVILSVSDTGPGFPPGMFDVGVRPFASGRAGGTGLGLAMVRRFTEDIHAELALSNLEPHGARVTVRLPCQGIVSDDRRGGPAND
jgi:two-component system NtrC family sensor kinase